MDLLEKFNKNGFVVIENAIGEEQIDRYNQLWQEKNSQSRDEQNRLVGWGTSSAYTQYDEIKDVLCSDVIFDAFEKLKIAVALHLDITYNTSTLKGWHQDCCLPNKDAGDNYVGVWVALEDISPDSGPFEIVIGAHKWDFNYHDLYVQKEGGRTLRTDVSSHDFFEKEINNRKAEIFTFVPKKGDILIWHGYGVHRGSIPINRGLTRRSLIGHYCNLHANYMQETSVEYEVAKAELMDKPFAQWGKGYFFVKPMEGYDTD